MEIISLIGLANVLIVFSSVFLFSKKTFPSGLVHILFVLYIGLLSGLSSYALGINMCHFAILGITHGIVTSINDIKNKTITKWPEIVLILLSVFICIEALAQYKYLSTDCINMYDQYLSIRCILIALFESAISYQFVKGAYISQMIKHTK